MRKTTRGVIVLVVTVLVAASAATAATPNTIYRDYEDNGRLDGRYSVADLRAALQNPSIQGYGRPTLEPEMRREIEEELGEQESLGSVGEQPTLPFTGFDLALLTVGGAMLLAVGLGLRRVARNKR
jgi:hypothetical protein